MGSEGTRIHRRRHQWMKTSTRRKGLQVRTQQLQTRQYHQVTPHTLAYAGEPTSSHLNAEGPGKGSLYGSKSLSNQLREWWTAYVTGINTLYVWRYARTREKLVIISVPQVSNQSYSSTTVRPQVRIAKLSNKFVAVI